MLWRKALSPEAYKNQKKMMQATWTIRFMQERDLPLSAGPCYAQERNGNENKYNRSGYE
jgi:hypothetical protein